MSTERKHREEIVRYGRMLHERGFVAAMDGNLSVRLSDRRILVTPTCLSKGAMRPADMVIVDMQGKRVAGRRNVTSEIGMHLLIYSMRPDIRAIVHAHPPTATGFAAAGLPLTEPLVCEVVIGLGCIAAGRDDEVWFAGGAGGLRGPRGAVRVAHSSPRKSASGARYARPTRPSASYRACTFARASTTSSVVATSLAMKP